MAMLQTFGLMGILDIPLNAANMIGLSLMLGMGMENGVLITHDYLSQRGPYRMSASTAVAVVLNTLTTMVGFAVLIIADHRGLQSLGRMLTINMACCLFSSLVILPTLLVWLTCRRKSERLSAEGAQHVRRTTAELTLSAGSHRRGKTPHGSYSPDCAAPPSASHQRIGVADD